MDGCNTDFRRRPGKARPVPVDLPFGGTCDRFHGSLPPPSYRGFEIRRQAG